MRYWKKLNPDGSTNTIESYSHALDIEGATEITEEEFNTFMASLPMPEPARDLSTEIDKMKAGIIAIKIKLGID